MLVHLTDGTVSVVVDVMTGAPTIVHWGAPLPVTPDEDALVSATNRPIAHGMLDVEPRISLVPEHGSGFAGRPGLAGHRKRGRSWAPRFTYESHALSTDGRTLTTVAIDAVAELRLTTRLALGAALVAQATITNEADEDRYLLDRLDVTLPLPTQAREVLRFTGRWTRELHSYRTPFEHGAFVTENRRGRTSHEHPPLLFAGTQAFGEWSGEVWGAHAAWSGNHHHLAEVLNDGRRYLQLGELFHPGELSLKPGESYSSPEVIAVYSASGLTPATWGFHRHLRARLGYVPSTRPRPVLLNTWEAVYFDHDTARLQELADSAAAVGIERFVLDDGWFGSRRNDRRGLGDWWVSPEVYPDGLTPLIDHVRALGMEFGIWVEPEMVNPDSDLYRAHPDWALATDGYEPVLGRQQLVLDLSNLDAFAHILDALDTLLTDHDIAYLKWDMNRDHTQASNADGGAGTHGQTLALYRLLDELRARHPGVEIESCASGGARIDHEILRRTDRVWTSDCNDALERQTIQRGASMFVPAEVMGAHIGPLRSHTTSRRQSLGFRAATAIFGHLGVEWNVLTLRDDERTALAEVIALHKRFRPLLHGGDTVRFDPLDGGLAHGVYAADRGEALVCYSQLTTSTALAPALLRLPGLDSNRQYRLTRIALPDDERERGRGRTEPAWMATGVTLDGATLAAIGVQLPVMNPESAFLLHLQAVAPVASVTLNR